MGNHLHFLKYYGLMIVICVSIAMVAQASQADLPRDKPMTIEEIVKSGQSCEECHEKTTPRIFREHMEGEHGKIGVSCADCHGNDHRNMPAATARDACEQCHPDETFRFMASGHSRTWENMANRILYSRQPEVIRRNSCEACHRIGKGDDDGRCDFCHSRHSFARKEAADPQSCSVCHMGPDRPQMEAYQHSPQHFTPATCAACHMPAGNHNAGENLEQLSLDFTQPECTKCHNAPFFSKWLQTSAIVEEQGRQYLISGRRIINMLRSKGRLYPDPRSSEPALETEQEQEAVPVAHRFYGDISRAEKLYFDMQRYLREHDIQGAYHQDFQLPAHDVLITVQQRLEELQAEALLLQELAAEKVQLTPLKSPVPPADTGDIYRLTYESSFHGVLADGLRKPSCETCHGSGEYRKTEAKAWAVVCGACHLPELVGQSVTDLGAIKDLADGFRHTADETVAKLIRKKVVARDDLGNITLPDDYKQNREVAQVLLARLVSYLDNLDRSLKIMTVAVAHGNPAYTLWAFKGPVRGDLIEIRDAAAKLLRMKKVFVDVSGVPFGPLPQEN